MSTRRPLEDAFHTAMLHLYYACAARLKPPYFASRFLELVLEQGGKDAADQLLASPALAPVFAELCLRGPEHLTYSVEHLVLQAPWRTLFSSEQLETARERLVRAGGALPRDHDVSTFTV
jgi:hypothetical protein